MTKIGLLLSISTLILVVGVFGAFALAEGRGMVAGALVAAAALGWLGHRAWQEWSDRERG